MHNTSITRMFLWILSFSTTILIPGLLRQVRKSHLLFLQANMHMGIIIITVSFIKKQLVQLVQILIYWDLNMGH